MELVPLSDRVLRTLAGRDKDLKRVFVGVFPADKLPKRKIKDDHHKRAYIVNTDPAGEPGQHWLELWTEGGVFEVLDYLFPFMEMNNYKTGLNSGMISLRVISRYNH